MYYPSKLNAIYWRLPATACALHALFVHNTTHLEFMPRRRPTLAVNPDLHAIQLMQSNRVGNLQKLTIPCTPAGVVYRLKVRTARPPP